MVWTSSDAKTLAAAFPLAGSVTARMTAAMRQMNQKRSVVNIVFSFLSKNLFLISLAIIILCVGQLRGRVSHTSSDVRTTAVCRAAGSATMTMTAGTTPMKTTAVSITLSSETVPPYVTLPCPLSFTLMTVSVSLVTVTLHLFNS